MDSAIEQTGRHECDTTKFDVTLYANLCIVPS